MRKFALVLAIAAFAGCSKDSESTTTPTAPAYGQSAQAPADKPLADEFADTWDHFVAGTENAAEQGGYALERMGDGAISVARSAERVAGEAGSEIADAAILTAVKSRLETTNDVMAQGINVDVEDGVVTLRGHVDSPRAAGDAVRLALDTRGVERVVSYLTWPSMRA
jgi:osmotically-inducible protein OsmY